MLHGVARRGDPHMNREDGKTNYVAFFTKLTAVMITFFTDSTFSLTLKSFVIALR